MPRTKVNASPKQGRLQRATSAIARLFTRDRKAAASHVPPAPQQQTRPVHLQSDIPMQELEEAYIPAQTSQKAGFRSTGADHGNDQEFALGVSTDQWNDEDRLTNKSGDPRIGTHGRTREPGETRAARGRNEENE